MCKIENLDFLENSHGETFTVNGACYKPMIRELSCSELNPHQRFLLFNTMRPQTKKFNYYRRNFSLTK